MRTFLKYVFGLFVIFFTWWLLSYIINSDLILPRPPLVLKTMALELMRLGVLDSLGSTLLKVIVVLISTVTVGVFIGFIIGLNETLCNMFRPLILVVQAIPIITWLALVMFIWGIGWTGPVVVSILSLLPHAILSTAVGIQTTDRKLLEMARVYKVSRKKVVKDIYLGSILPQFLSAIQVIFGNVWKVVVVSEYMCGDNGIGVLIAWARQSVSVEKVYAYTAIIIIIGLTVENFVNRFIKNALKNWELV
ncbi:MAG: ABC transporter permease subunit [Fervidobacterium sp.]|uniref:NitT/TauT family transport system permease protein n=1 Tax=Fervidobacterium gondwanense DSM 13020 TaxID=1121883 RepID=A0A1M7SCV5_FERGO|nr:ABC transporter permease subunit [Fervidobacterium gondwanense]SHN56320.1 NitT/TauT family transport system permease protein [Fervidobacterium gondwanense DSM 13020]